MELLLPLVILTALTALVATWAMAWGPPQRRWPLADVGTVFLLFIGTAGLSGIAICKWMSGSWEPQDDALMPGVLGTLHAGLLASGLVLRRASPAALGLVASPRWGWGAAGAGVPLFLAVSATWAMLASQVGLEIEPQQMLAELSGVPVPDRWVLVAYGAVGAPIVEELLFRGFLLPPLVRRTGELAAVSASGCLFGLAHMSDPYAVVPLVVLGMGLGWLRLRTASLWPGILVHAANNTIALASSLFGTTL
ncbi:MAG: hypothetical protein CL927_18730 [Deltaproteobacteria bacterium]|nr:hypothetical protein [Deltaproteobacteria bacterium]HCH62171.1 hypothetical protein [Deltaproteobacteria bacterium]